MHRAGSRLAFPMLNQGSMSGLVTERDLEEADTEFPGIGALYARLPEKPRTFLDLVRLYFQRQELKN
jgi:hypothetical protein